MRDFPKGALNYWKSSFLSELSDQAIDVFTACFCRCPTPMGALLIEHFHGAACRVGVSNTAFAHRKVGSNLLILAEWMDLPIQRSAKLGQRIPLRPCGRSWRQAAM